MKRNVFVRTISIALILAIVMSLVCINFAQAKETITEPSKISLSTSNVKVCGSWTSEGTSTFSKLVDGQLNTKWNPQIKDSGNDKSGIMVDLGDVYDVSMIQLVLANTMIFSVAYSADSTCLNDVDSSAWTTYATNVSMAAGTDSTGSAYTNTEGKYSTTISNARYLKITFTKRDGAAGNFWMNFFELSVFGVAVNNYRKLNIKSAEVTGTWKTSNVDSASVGLAKAYDGNDSTKWNPEANSGFSGDVGAIFELADSYYLSGLRLFVSTSDGSQLRFNAYTSDDKSTWTQTDSVVDFTLYESGVVYASLTSNAKAKYVKVIFTARKSGTFVNCHEITIYGSSVPCQSVEMKLDITAHQITGQWATTDKMSDDGNAYKTYDGSATTMWNPLTNAYQGHPAIVYTLKDYYDLTKITTVIKGGAFYDIYVSTDGENFSKIKTVDSSNAADSITTETDALKVKYVRVELTGRSNNGGFVNFYEISIYGTSVIQGVYSNISYNVSEVCDEGEDITFDLSNIDKVYHSGLYKAKLYKEADAVGGDDCFAEITLVNGKTSYSVKTDASKTEIPNGAYIFAIVDKYGNLISDRTKVTIGSVVGGLSAELGTNVNFKLLIDLDEYPTLSKTGFIVNGEKTGEKSNPVAGTIPVEKVVDGNKVNRSLSLYVIELNAKEIGAKVAVYGEDSEGTTLFTSESYSIVDYCLMVIGDKETYGAEAVDLCKALINYGAYAQLELDYNTDDLANKVLDESERSVDTTVSFAEYAPELDGESTSIAFAGLRLSLLTDVSIKLYFEASSNTDVATNHTFKIDDQTVSATEVASTQSIAKFFEVEITGISADDFAKSFVVSADDIDVTISVFGYAKLVMAQEGENWNTTKNLVAAMYELYTATCAYSK